MIALVLLLAWLMFVVHLDYESMSADEWVSWNSALQGPLGLVRVTADDVHPPVYYLLLWAWMTLIGNQSLLILRLTAAFPALLTVAMSYRLALDWFKNRRWTISRINSTVAESRYAFCCSLDKNCSGFLLRR